MKRIVVLGCGLVGAPMALDLTADRNLAVTAVDADGRALDKLRGARRIRPLRRDLSHPDAVVRVVKDADLVISAVPGRIGFRTLEAVIGAGRPVVDIAFFPEDPFLLEAEAVRRGVTAVVDCGVAPGMSNLLAARAAGRLDEARRLEVYVGGLPLVRKWPYEYKAGFSPSDVIEEYLRPARLVRGGRVIVRPALSDLELLDFPGVGTLEAFNTDGLRTLLSTLDVPDMSEKTLRYPGHAEKIALLRETGFFDSREVDVGGVQVRPRDLTSRLLFPKWKLGEGETDITVMRVVVEGKRRGREERIVYDLFDQADAATGVHSMARTTGFTATVASRMVLRGLYDRRGISPLEFIGRREECAAFMMAGLRERGVVYRESTEPD
jgi:saccharopine dehydrogenase-like NADP-dependent oxidoreductase